MLLFFFVLLTVVYILVFYHICMYVCFNSIVFPFGFCLFEKVTTQYRIVFVFFFNSINNLCLVLLHYFPLYF